jgi:hypothetical protein
VGHPWSASTPRPLTTEHQEFLADEVDLDRFEGQIGKAQGDGQRVDAERAARPGRRSAWSAGTGVSTPGWTRRLLRSTDARTTRRR